MWEKPVLLRNKDCGAATRVPPPEESYEVHCSNCLDQIAILHCEDCDLPFCSPCYDEVHRGAKKCHIHVEYSRCVQCDFQMSTRLCDQCEDLFCDTCYGHMHRKGRYRIHTFTWMVPKCQTCGKRAAQWRRVVEATDFVPEDLCVPCIRAQYSEDPLAPAPIPEPTENVPDPVPGPRPIDLMPWVQRIQYLGHSVVEHRKAVAAAAKRKVNNRISLIFLLFFLLLFLLLILFVSCKDLQCPDEVPENGKINLVLFWCYVYPIYAVLNTNSFLSVYLSIDQSLSPLRK